MNVMVVGGGKVGRHVASLLLQHGHGVKVIEQDPSHLARLQREAPAAVAIAGNGTDPVLLDYNGIRQMNVVAAVTGADETNLVVAGLARSEFHVPRTIARVNDSHNAWLFTPEMGVDVALNQADLMAHLIVEEMSLGDMVTLLKLRKGQYSLVEEKVHPNALAAGQAVRDLDLPAECVLTAVIRKGDLIVPRGDTVLQAADEVLALVHQDQVTYLAALLGSGKPAA